MPDCEPISTISASQNVYTLNSHFHPLELPQERIRYQTYSGISMRLTSQSRYMDIIHPMHSIDHAFGEFSFALDQPSVGFIDRTSDTEVSNFHAMCTATICRTWVQCLDSGQSNF